MFPRTNPAVMFQSVPEDAILLLTEQEAYFGLNQHLSADALLEDPTTLLGGSVVCGPALSPGAS